MESEPQVHDDRREKYKAQDVTKTRSGRTVKPTKYLQYDVKGTPSVSEISCRKVTPDTAASDHLHNRSSGCSCVADDRLQPGPTGQDLSHMYTSCAGGASLSPATCYPHTTSLH